MNYVINQLLNQSTSQISNKSNIDLIIYVSLKKSDFKMSTLWSGAKSPKFAAHSKYFFPSTEPSFFPIGASSSIPAHSPLAKSVGPKYLNNTGVDILNQTETSNCKLEDIFKILANLRGQIVKN